MKYLLFLNVKRWLIEYGVDVLDLLMNPIDLTTTNPKERYGENFMQELNLHFSTGEFYENNFYSHLPLLKMNVHDLGYSTTCNHQYMIEFTYHFTTVSAKQEYLICNTPEEMLRLEDDLDRYLSCMFESWVTLENGRQVKRTLFRDMCNLDGFDGCINNVVSIDGDTYPITYVGTTDEVITLNKQFIITIGECYGRA